MALDPERPIKIISDWEYLYTHLFGGYYVYSRCKNNEYFPCIFYRSNHAQPRKILCNNVGNNVLIMFNNFKTDIITDIIKHYYFCNNV